MGTIWGAKDALAAVGADFDKQVVALDLRNMPTEDVMKKVAAAFEKLDGKKS